MVATALTSLLIGAPSAGAKGDSYLVGARLFGGQLGTRSIEVPIALPENYDDMGEAEPPPGERGSVDQGVGYQIELRYDFSEYGYGLRQHRGWYDGNDRIFFPEAMQVGQSGVWAAGWFTATPLLAASLRAALSPAPPSTGTGSASREGVSPVSGTLLLLAASVWVVVLYRGYRYARLNFESGCDCTGPH